MDELGSFYLATWFFEYKAILAHYHLQVDFTIFSHK